MKFKERNIYKLILITVNALLLLLAPLFLINLLRVGVTKIIQSKQTWHFIWRPYFIDGRFLLNEWIYIQEHDECIDENNCLFWFPITKSTSGWLEGKNQIAVLLNPNVSIKVSNTTSDFLDGLNLHVKQELDKVRLNPNLNKEDLDTLKQILSTKPLLVNSNETNSIDGLNEKEFLKRFKHNLKDGSSVFFRARGSGG
jgi:hypothetical protein